MSAAASIPMPRDDAEPATLDLSRRAEGHDPARAAADDAMRLAASHYENFPVVTRLVPRRLRADFAAVYAYCRTCDDLADETGTGPEARARSLALLARFREMFTECEAHARDASRPEPTHPVFIALARTIRAHELPPEPFHHLIDAFEQDQRLTRYETWSQTLDYCTRSADPVGRIILRLAGRRPTDPDWHDLLAMSDATCTALQLTNFWQDVRRDLLDRDRVYLPSETGITADHLREWADESRGAPGSLPANRIRYIETVRDLCARTRALFDQGRPLPARLGPHFGRVVWMFGAGGESILSAIERAGCTTLWRRPRLSALGKIAVVLRGAAQRFPARHGSAA